ncbi:MAG: hypothetical protein ABSE42_14665, partial [Bryobacteraceae bacterium]
ALSSAQVLPEWTTSTPPHNDFSANGDNPLNFVSHDRGSLQGDETPNFSAAQNNGRIVSSSDAITGENVSYTSYTYDSLNRLIAAATTDTTRPVWGNSYTYDGFGNLTSKVPTQGTAPQVYQQVNSVTNQTKNG